MRLSKSNIWVDIYSWLTFGLSSVHTTELKKHKNDNLSSFMNTDLNFVVTVSETQHIFSAKACFQNITYVGIQLNFQGKKNILFISTTNNI